MSIPNKVAVWNGFFSNHVHRGIKRRFGDNIEKLDIVNLKNIDYDYYLNKQNEENEETKKINIKDCQLLLTFTRLFNNYEKIRIGHKLNSNNPCSIVRYGFGKNYVKIIDNKELLSRVLKDENFVPKTIIYNVDNDYNNFKKLWENEINFRICILKPKVGEQQRGIAVVSSLDEAWKHINMYKKESSWLLQQYIHNPMLIKGQYLFPGLKNGVKIPSLHNEDYYYNDNDYFKTHIRTYTLIIYDIEEKVYKIYVYGRYKYNTARSGYPLKIFKGHFDINDLKNGGPHKSGGNECGASPFDFQELCQFCYEKNEGMIPLISPTDMKNKIEIQVEKIIGITTKKIINLGCCLRPSEKDHSVMASKYNFNVIATDLMIDENQKVWYIESNSSPGFKMFVKDISLLFSRDGFLNFDEEKAQKYGKFDPNLYYHTQKINLNDDDWNMNKGLKLLSNAYDFSSDELRKRK